MRIELSDTRNLVYQKNDGSVWSLVKEGEGIPKEADLVGYEYRKFLLIHDKEYGLWSIQTLERDIPPEPLRGNWTHQNRAKAAIDYWQDVEAKKLLKNERTNSNSLSR